MALTPITIPNAYSPVRDPVWVELLCGGFRTAAPVTAVFILTLLEDAEAGQSFGLELPDASLLFTFVSGTPDDSGTQIQVGVDTVATLANIFTTLQANHFMDQLFSMVLVDDVIDYIVLTARAAGDLPVSFTDTIPSTMDWFEFTAGSAATYNANYRPVLQVWVERTWNSGVYVALPAWDGRPRPTDRTFRWDIRRLLYPEVRYDWPAYNIATMVVQRTLQRRYYLAWWELYGDPVVPRAVHRTEPAIAWFGGSRQIEREAIVTLWPLVQQSEELTPFLTYLGRQGMREVSPLQHVYLSWYRNTVKVAGQQLFLYAEVTYSDGTTDDDEIWTDTNGTAWEVGDVALWNVGFRSNDLHLLQPSKTPVSYTLQVYNQAAVALSELYTLHLLHTEASEQQIEWVNSLGVTESTRCKGQWERGIAVENQAVERWRAIDNELVPNVQESDRRMLLVGGQQRLKISTGFMDASECEALTDLLLSPEHRVVDHARALRHPLSLVAGEYITGAAGTEEEHMYALNLEFLLHDTERAWSNRAGMPPVPDEIGPPDS